MTSMSYPDDIGGEFVPTRPSLLHWDLPEPREPGQRTSNQTGPTQRPGALAAETALQQTPSVLSRGRDTQEFGVADSSHYPIELKNKPKINPATDFTTTEQRLIENELTFLRSICEPIQPVSNVRQLCDQLQSWQTNFIHQLGRLQSLKDVTAAAVEHGAQKDLLLRYQAQLRGLIADTEAQQKALLTAQLSICTDPECTIYSDMGDENLATVSKIDYLPGFGMLITINNQANQTQQQVTPDRLRKLMTKPVAQGPKEDTAEGIATYIHSTFSGTPLTILSIGTKSNSRKRQIKVRNQFHKEWTIDCHITGEATTSHNPLSVVIDQINDYRWLGENNTQQFHRQNLTRKNITKLTDFLNQPEPKPHQRAFATAKKWLGKLFSQ